MTEEDSCQTARSVALQMMASVKEAGGGLDRVKRVIRLFGTVNSAAGYKGQFAVIDGAADLFYEPWGLGFVRHARAAVGIADLARGPILEIMGELEITAA